MTVPEATARPDDAVVLELEPVLRAYRTHHGDASDSAIHRAYAVAHRLHAGQFRKSGEPFISHPLTVAQILAEYGRMLEAAERRGAHSIEARTGAILNGLDLSDLDQDTEVDILSGGQKTRLGLARLLVSSPDLLLSLLFCVGNHL